MNRLDVFQSMWAMEFDRPDGFQWTLEQKLEKIAGAGFSGVSFDIPHHSREMIERAQPYLREYGLDVTLNAFADNSATYQSMTQWANELSVRPVFFSLVGQIQPWNLNSVAEQTRQWLNIGKAAGFPTHVEVHRNCMTNDFLFTLQLMEQVPELMMVADLSHALINQEWYLPISEQANALVTQFLKRAHAFHGRVGTREQSQISFGFAQHQGWFELFQNWWRQGFQLWQQRNINNDRERCIFLCELGPPPYAITDAAGNELSDRWLEAIILKSTARRLWNEALALNNQQNTDNQQLTEAASS